MPMRLRSSFLVLALVLGAVAPTAATHAADGWFQQNVTTPAAIGPMVYDFNRGGILMFNGTETWTWNTASATWTQLTPVHEPVMQGGDFAMAFDALRGVAVLIDSPPTSIPKPTDTLSTWLWDGTDWTQQQPAHSPTPRFDHSQNLVYDSNRGVTVLFSGQFSNDNSPGDTWEWNGIDWTQNTTAGGSVKRFRHCMTYDSDRSRVVLQGGEYANGSATSELAFDTWQYDGTSWSVTNIPQTFFLSAGCSMTYDPELGRTINIARSNGSSGPLTPFYWDGQTWTEVGPTGPTMVQWRSAYDFGSNTVVVVGSDSFGGSNQTWLLNPNPQGPPPPPGPVITAISPAYGSSAGGTSVTITGSGFTGATSVGFGGGPPQLSPCVTPPTTQICFTVDSDTQITAISPPVDASLVHISVTTPSGSSFFTPADLFLYEGWFPPTPLANTPVNVPMTNPPTQVTFTVTLLESGIPTGPQIASSSLPSDVTCSPSSAPVPAGTAGIGFLTHMDCSASPLYPQIPPITFSDANDATRVPTRTVSFNVLHQGYRPNPDGFNFTNPSDSSPSLDAMAADYPASHVLTSPGHATILGAQFYDFFKSQTKIGLCYGVAAASGYYYNDYPGGPFMPFGQFLGPGSTLPDGTTIQSFIERYYSRQFAEIGALDAISRYNDASALGNMGVFNQLAGQLHVRPETVGIFPAKSINLPRFNQFAQISHQVVAYDAVQAPGQDPQIKVYDPDAPNDPNAVITITKDGGMKLIGKNSIRYGGGVVNGQDLGQPSEWLVVPIPDFTWLDNSQETIAGQQVDNKHWILDAPVPLAFELGSAVNQFTGFPIFIASDAGAGTRGQLFQLAAGGSFSGTVSTAQANGVVGEFSGNHVASATQTDAAAVGTSHQLDIDTTASRLRLYGASSTQQYTLQLGADYLPNYGRSVTLTGVRLVPNATIDMTTDAAMSGFSVSSTGATQTVTATLVQVGQPASSTNVQVAIPGGGGQASITVFDWTDLAHSLIYETTQVGGVQTVTILQDNPTERKAAVDGLFHQLTAAIATITDPNLATVLNSAVRVAEFLYHHGDRKAAAAVLIGVEQVTKALSGTKIAASTATSIIALSQQIRGLF
jgi:hypothetical protein